MNDAETQIFLTGCDHALTFTMAQIRMAVAHATPVAQSLEHGSANRDYLERSLLHLHQLHGYLLDQLGRLNAMSAEIGNRGKGKMQIASGEESLSESVGESGSTEYKVH
ncbi:hypothetical protein [Burkholderia cenocepacia]|uniref:hypothetical protein n=1 Tax=Burkholderia cenocepacia TaxID=95486 RepID=UPI00075EA54B|nr:hypothetical protein [Burkholderia cenocepacia]KVF49493.1 hypothetical protein WJ14_31535 [Burkholderia cenocepacia]